MSTSGSMCDAQTIAVIARSFAYILAAGGGLMCIFLGYRLYVKGVISEVSGGGLRSGWSLTLKAAGPGVFLVLFGAWILVHIITTPGTFSEERIEPAPSSSAAGPEAGRLWLAAAPRQTPPAEPCSKVRCTLPAGSVVIRKGSSFVDGGAVSRDRIAAATGLALELLDREIAAGVGKDSRLKRLNLARRTLQEINRQVREPSS